MTLSNVSIFDKKDNRDNLLIEIFRMTSLFLLLILHSHYVTSTINNNAYLIGKLVRLAQFFGVFPFVIITGIYTVGKGKTYFFRNLSRLSFVVVIFSVVNYLLVYQSNLNQVQSVQKYSWWLIVIGGRDTWYLWQITFASIFLPLLKIDKYIKKWYLNLAFVSLVVIAFSLPYYATGWFTAGVQLFFIALASYVLKRTLDNVNNKLVAAIFLFLAVPALYIKLTYNWEYMRLITLMIFVVLLIKVKIRIPKRFKWFVKYSYFVYEFHYVAQYLLTLALIRVNHASYAFITNFGQWTIGILSIYIVSTGASMILSYIQFNIWEVYVSKYVFYKNSDKRSKQIIIFSIFMLIYIIYNIMGILSVGR